MTGVVVSWNDSSLRDSPARRLPCQPPNGEDVKASLDIQPRSGIAEKGVKTGGNPHDVALTRPSTTAVAVDRERLADGLHDLVARAARIRHAPESQRR
jgi:hypothetical protein